MAVPAPGRTGALDLLGARVCFTGRADGDLRPQLPGGADRLEAVAGRPVSWLLQVHGRRVVLVEGGQVVAVEEGDALVTADRHAALAVLTADCAPVALSSAEGVVAAVHAGWAGLAAGVVGESVAAMRALGATAVEAALGPCIHAECYEFGAADLDRMTTAFGPHVRSTTAWGTPALDLPAAVAAALHQAGATLAGVVDQCTACGGEHWFSHRARGEPERQAMLVWAGDE